MQHPAPTSVISDQGNMCSSQNNKDEAVPFSNAASHKQITGFCAGIQPGMHWRQRQQPSDTPDRQ
jgi:hypothetical protein